MKTQYEPKTTKQALGYLVEECGEVLAAVGKTQRWGWKVPIQIFRQKNEKQIAIGF